MDQVEGAAAYLRALARARAATADGRWGDAAALWEEVAAANPVEGRGWAHLADACYQAQDYRRAIAAAGRVLDLGAGLPPFCAFPFDAAYRIACCHALLGEREAALRWLATAFDRGYRDLARARTDPDLAALRDDLRYRDIVGLVDTTGLSRDAGWRADVALLVREVKRLGYAPFRVVPEAEFDAAVRALHDAIPRFSDARIVAELMTLLRLAGDGHTRLERGFDVVPAMRQTLPLQFYLFAEGLFVVAADPAYEDLLGAQVLRFGDRPVDELCRALDPLVSRDNEQWPNQVIPYRLRELPLLHALDLVPQPGRVDLTVHDRDGRERVATVATDERHPDIWYDYPCPVGWRFFPETLAAPVPAYLRNMAANYWFEHLPGERAIYCQFNRVRDDPAEPLADFTARLLARAEGDGVDRLVLDLRWNNGGNTFLELPLLHGLIGSNRLNRRGALFVVVGRRTFSAAQNLASLLDRHTAAIFVGEPTGSSPNFIGETIIVELPYSKLRASISDLSWQSSWPMDYRTWLAPDLYAPPTFAAYRENRDPALEAALACRERLPGW